MLLATVKTRRAGLPKPILRVVPVINPEDYIGLACAIALPFVKKGQDVKDSDEFGECMFALARAIERHDGDRGAFPKFAAAVMRNQLFDFKKKKEIQTDSIGEQDVQDNSNSKNHLELLNSFFQDHSDDSAKDKRDKSVLKRHYLEGITWKELGNELGVSREAARKYGESAAKLIRNRFNVGNF